MPMNVITRMSNEFYRAGEWYWERYWYFIQEENKSSKQAYLKTEEEWHEKYGVNRFTDYNSFRQGKYRREQPMKKATGEEEEASDPDQLELF